MNEARVRIAESTAAIACPCCSRVLRDFEIEPRLIVNFCQDCRIAWCDNNELGRILGVKESETLGVLDQSAAHFAPFGETANNRPMCPRCKTVHLVEAAVQSFGLRHCPSCSGNLIDLATVGKMKRELAAVRKAVVGATEQLQSRAYVAPPATASAAPAFSSYGYDTLTAALAIPVAMIIGFAAQALGLGSLVVLLGGTLPHEFGHAIAAWLGGYFAFPTFFVTLTFSEESSRGIALLVAFSIVSCYLLWFWKGRRIAPLEAALIKLGFIALAAANIKLAWLSSTARQQEVFIVGGLIGEFALTVACVAAFCFRSVPIPRWDFWRYPVLLFGAMHFVGSWTNWGRVLAGGVGAIPWGAMLGATTADGDFSKLRDVYGWTGAEILKLIRQLRVVGMGAIILFAVFQFRLLFQKRIST